MKEKWVQEAVEQLISVHSLQEDEEMAALIREHAYAAMKFRLDGEEDYAQVGNSRLAGEPDLPEGWQWPLTEDGEAYTFLAQINLGELPFVPDPDCPKSGMLYLFLGVDEPAYQVDHRVLFFDGDLQQLRRTGVPEGVPTVDEVSEREFVAHRLVFGPHLSLPDLGDNNDVLSAEYDTVYEEICDVSDALFGGYQSWSGDTRMDAYLCSNQMSQLLFNTHETEERLQKKALDAYADGRTDYAQSLEETIIPMLRAFNEDKPAHRLAADQWKVLFSLSSVNEADMCWWDAGYLEFFIDAADLRDRNFSRTYLNLATS